MRTPRPQRAALYLRVSTSEQSTDNQRPDLEQLAGARGLTVVTVYEEHASAAKVRPEFDKMLKAAHAGKFDVVVIWALDRLGRSMVGNLQVVLELDRLGVQVISAREPWLDTGGPVRPLLIAIFGWVAEQERLRIVERTRAGIERARRSGKVIGRPHATVDLARALTLRSQGLSIRKVAKTMGINSSTLHRVLQAHGLGETVVPITPLDRPCEDPGLPAGFEGATAA